jgi:CRISPR-associated endonuclease Csn1
MLELDDDKHPCGVINMGVRIFPDGRDDKSKEPLSVSRRTYRGIRRNLDRFLERRKSLLEFFDRNSFLPQDTNARKLIFAQDPYLLRATALDKELTLAEIARAFLHLAQRRGFKSNRKQTSAEKDTKLTEATENLKKQLEEHHSRSLGEYLYSRNADLANDMHHLRKPLKFRYEKEYSEEERIFPTREMVEAEFELIWDTQAKYHQELTDKLKAELKNLIFYQRPLKKQLVGKCTLEPEEDRCHKAYPLFQENRIRQEINILKLINTWDNSTRELTFEEKEALYQQLYVKESIKFDALRTKLLGKAMADEYRFNSETENKKSLQGNLTNVAFRKQKELYPVWENLNLQQQSAIIDILQDDALNDEAALLALKDSGLTQELALQALNVHLPADHGNLSVKALNKILPFLRQGVNYYEACLQAGYSHSGFYTGEVFEEGNLPYYGELLTRATLPLQRQTHDSDADEHGKINNPTVHIALNQLRKIVNALSLRYGAPAEIALELARELKLGQKQNDEINKTIGKNTKTNERIVQELNKLNVENNAENRLRYKLWEELAPDDFNRCCVYTGRQISQTRLFTPEFEIEHILPKSRTYDDNSANKTISYRGANHEKGERSPFEAFGMSPGSYDWKAICERANKLPDNKKWRFQKDAMERFANESDVLDRMLNDTKYMTTVARDYMQYVVGDKKVTTCNGKLTATLRRKWGLNALINEADNKDRSDHRHHAIDAFVIAMTDRTTVKRFADSVKQSKERFLEKLPQPYTGFKHEELQQKIDKLTVSFKPDQVNPSLLRSRNQTTGGLVKETAYAYVGTDPEDPKFAIYCVRQDVTGLSAKNVANLKDPYIKQQLLDLLQASDNEKDFQQKLPDWAKRHNIKKVKLLEKANPKSMIPVYDKKGRAYKYYASDENLYADIYNPKPFDPKSKWQIEIVKSYDAHLPNFTPDWKKQNPMGKLIMRVYKNDVIAYTNEQGERELRRVRKMSGVTLYLRELIIAKKPISLDSIGEQFKPTKLLEANACKAGVDVIGRYFDPNAKKIE